ncbi:UvrD-helicase domain-containing protein [Anaplasma capra]|uniref:UvrD-helicase domain-containing protein n=1 Tax=Anaplasma capra TaxID=1562740 RepID=UPI0021D5F66C|nr:UvrD-helicase domain-containing protein [Anaplasma capra]MCU7611904.1 UvrD-helicase domain-containing protein [Anaplasma capra]MCU7612763.1 UvrD-helicase domain-containing protein [Anaplasma capra]
MKNYKLDIQQQNATDPEREFVWISASAGTGKTGLLVHRIIRLMISGQRNILCLTFTNSAVREIRERIYGIIAEWLTLPENRLADTLREVCYRKISSQHCIRARQLFFDIPSILKIQTVHSFCYSLISSFPIETGVSVDFGIRELSEAYPSIFAQLLREDRSIDHDLSEISAELKEGTLYDLMYQIINKQCKISAIEAPPQNAPVDPKEITCPTQLIDALKCGGIRDKKVSAKLNAWNSSAKKSPEKVAEYLSIFIDLQSLEEKPITSISSKNTIEQFPEIAQIIEREQAALLKFAEQFYTWRIAKRTFHLARIAQRCVALYEQDKKHSRYLDYNDVVRLALNLIIHPDHKDAVLFRLDSKIDHILVDESQDNSLEQWNIVAALCSEFFSGLGSSDSRRTLFIVGDVKQSIYRFQNARPDYFHLMHQYFSAQSNDALAIQLYRSFRSTKPILLLVDRIFNALREQVSFQSQEIKHVAYRESDHGYVEVWPLVNIERRKKPYAWDEPEVVAHSPRATNTLLLAQTVARTIGAWITSGRMLAAKNRPVNASDILILVRCRSLLVDQMIAELRQAGVPVASRDRFNVMDYVAVQDLVNLGEFLLLPENDMALAALLKSPIFRLTDDDLLNITNSCTDTVSLWSKLQAFTELDGITNYLTSLIGMSKNRSPLDLYYFVLSEHREKLLQYLGQASGEIIDEFVNLLIKFGLNNLCTLESFIHWIKHTNPEVKIDTGAQENAIRIMTVHSAKGMQSPIVFLPDTTSIPKCELQIVFDTENTPIWCSGDTNARCRDLRMLKRQEEYNEYLRLLYVAMTRAEDELYVAGVGPSCGQSWYSIITSVGSDVFAKKQATLYPAFKDEVDVLYTENHLINRPACEPHVNDATTT